MNDIGIDLVPSILSSMWRGRVLRFTSRRVALNKRPAKLWRSRGGAGDVGTDAGAYQRGRPLVEDLISDFEVTEEMIAYLLRKAEAITEIIWTARFSRRSLGYHERRTRAFVTDL